MVKSNYVIHVTAYYWDIYLKTDPAISEIPFTPLGKNKETFSPKDFMKIFLWNADSPFYCLLA